MFKWLRKIEELLSGDIDNKTKYLQEELENIRQDNIKRDIRINRIFSRLNSHFMELKQHGKTIKSIREEFSNFNKEANRSTTAQQTIQVNRLNKINHIAEKESTPESLTPKEKSILRVFLEHGDMSLSYKDIAQVLNKNPITIKTQIHKLQAKSGMFDEIADNSREKRYKLKDKKEMEICQISD